MYTCTYIQPHHNIIVNNQQQHSQQWQWLRPQWRQHTNVWRERKQTRMERDNFCFASTSFFWNQKWNCRDKVPFWVIQTRAQNQNLATYFPQYQRQKWKTNGSGSVGAICTSRPKPIDQDDSTSAIYESEPSFIYYCPSSSFHPHIYLLRHNHNFLCLATCHFSLSYIYPIVLLLLFLPFCFVLFLVRFLSIFVLVHCFFLFVFLSSFLFICLLLLLCLCLFLMCILLLNLLVFFSAISSLSSSYISYSNMRLILLIQYKIYFVLILYRQREIEVHFVTPYRKRVHTNAFPQRKTHYKHRHFKSKKRFLDSWVFSKQKKAMLCKFCTYITKTTQNFTSNVVAVLKLLSLHAGNGLNHLKNM